MKPIFMDQLLQLRNLLKTFEIAQDNFIIHLSRKDAIDLLEYNESNIEILKDKKIFGCTMISAGEVNKTFIEISN